MENYTANLKTISGGLNAALETIRKLIESDSIKPQIRAFAVDLIRDIDGRDHGAIAERVFNYLIEHVKYVHDPTHTEYIQDLENTLNLGFGDCDDFATAGGTLLNAVGVKTRIVVAAYNLFGDPDYSHVYLEYFDNNTWHTFDPTIESGFNQSPYKPTHTKQINLTEGDYMHNLVTIEKAGHLSGLKNQLGDPVTTAVAVYKFADSIGLFDSGPTTYNVSETDKARKAYQLQYGVNYRPKYHPNKHLIEQTKKVQMAEILRAFGINKTKSTREKGGKQEYWYQGVVEEWEQQYADYLEQSNYFLIAGDHTKAPEATPGFRQFDYSGLTAATLNENTSQSPINIEAPADISTPIENSVELPTVTVPVKAGLSTPMILIGSGILLYLIFKGNK